MSIMLRFIALFLVVGMCLDAYTGKSNADERVDIVGRSPAVLPKHIHQ